MEKDKEKEIEMTCCRKFRVYFFIGFNIFISLLILLLLFLATYDVDFLNWYKYIYLILSTMVWLLLFCQYVAKLVLILIGKLPPKYLKLIWICLNVPAFVFFLIGFIFDLVMYSNNDIAYIIYNIIYWVFFILFGVFTVFDFFHIKYQIQLSEKAINNKANINKETIKEDKLEDVKIHQKSAESINEKIKEN